jgi:tetratricopeptide (TPR) repeat protein
VSSDEVFRRSERGFRTVKRESRRQANIIRLKHGIKFGMKAGFVVAVLALIVFTSVWVYFDYQRRQQLAAIDALIANYGAIDGTGTQGPEGGPSVAEAISSIGEGATSEPRYARALELLKAGKYQEAEPLLEAVAEDKKKLAANGKETAAAFRNLAPIAAISNHDKAGEYYAEAAELDPDHVEGMFWNGWFQAEAGSLDEAETAYQRVISTSEAREHDWAHYWARLGVGDIRLIRGDFSAATAAYQAASEMADRLAEADPDKSDLPVAFISMGDVRMAQGNLAEALTPYRKGLAIIERLAKADPDNTGWQRDLVASYGRVGSVLAQQGEKILARDTFYRGRSILAQLKDQFADDVQLPKRLTAFDAEIANLEQAQAAQRGTQSEQAAQ